MCDEITVAAAELLAGLCCRHPSSSPLEPQVGHLLLEVGGLLVVGDLVFLHGARTSGFSLG